RCGDQRVDSRAKACRRGEAQLGRRHCRLQITVLAKLRGAMPASRHMGLHVPCVPGIELVVEKSVQENFGFVAGHFGRPPAAIHASRNMERARARRGITVPTGAPITSAISRYDKPLISRKTITSRNTHGSDATRPWIVSLSTLEIIAISGVSCGSVHIGAADSK